MKSRRHRIFPILVAAALCGLLGVLLFYPGDDAERAPGTAKDRADGTVARSRLLIRPAAPLPESVADAPAVRTALKATRPGSPASPDAQTNAGGASPRAATAAQPGKEPPRDPLAREMLAYVGADLEAEAYWYDAINDPGLPATERQDLIEDLNEDGLSDPRNPTAEDLPLILNRLELIEAIRGDALDQVNADAFEEAYKDLLNLAALVLGGGQPVR